MNLVKLGLHFQYDHSRLQHCFVHDREQLLKVLKLHTRVYVVFYVISKNKLATSEMSLFEIDSSDVAKSHHGY